jgi:hypothetical protein
MKSNLFATATFLTASIAALSIPHVAAANTSPKRCYSSADSLSSNQSSTKRLPWQRLVFIPDCSEGLKAPPL